MGQFSYHFSDTDNPIYSTEGHQVRVAMVYLEDGVQKVVYEDAYEGYGEFGGIDFYDLIPLMNPEMVEASYPGNPDWKTTRKLNGHNGVEMDLRDIGIDIYFGNKPYKSPQLFEEGIPDVVDFDQTVRSHDNQGWYFEDEDEDEEW